MNFSDNFTDSADNLTESLKDLNQRYAKALVPLTVTFGFFTLFGVLGNLLILLVFSLSRDYRRNNFKVFVLTLAVIDLVICLTLIPAEMVKQRHYFAFGDVLSCKVKTFFNVFGASASCLALLVISIDRFRKVVQPFKTQMTPTIAVRILIAVAFVFPILLSIPGTIMSGIKTANMTNKYGENTIIHLCETEERYEKSVWRIIYKWVFIILLFGISLTYIVLYSFVMREAGKQIKAMANQRKNSFDITLSSGIYDPNAIIHEPLETEGRHHPTRVSINVPEQEPLTEDGQANGTLRKHSNNKYPLNGSLRKCELKRKKLSKQLSLRSVRSHTPMLHRHGFPTKTIIWFILTIVFIITYMTHIFLALKVGKIVYMSPDEFSSFSFFFRIYFVNHMINPIVYAIFVKRFRTSCKNLFPLLKSRVLNYCRGR
ncbi:cholecystokinin receptor type A-like [Mya arenaria]|uniref:cholecystokinin receptor type A-like n=1 Tax=Mya arenaria TaxID=6604 RepID=UPI0022E25D81|nr:cholecystokinin receptor type A-like [Mya arenaria]XP_052787913.1 cholecystokinin receptor type A-like [Mya arenaria]XP_052787958.1 cholecystokinin receptor type A-like [Mya arenaria]XP_052787959.1 cholecystokinin receptor type A-like [Mya arenaria]